jgi:hypothetical protein
LSPPVVIEKGTSGTEGAPPPLPKGTEAKPLRPIPADPGTPPPLPGGAASTTADNKESRFIAAATPVTSAPGPLVPIPATAPTPGAPVVTVSAAPAPATPAAPQPLPAPVKSYATTTYVVKQGESFESLSNTFYQNKKYAQALQQWMSNHGAMAETIKEKGGLTAGMTVAIPPKEVLEQEFPLDIH